MPIISIHITNQIHLNCKISAGSSTQSLLLMDLLHVTNWSVTRKTTSCILNSEYWGKDHNIRFYEIAILLDNFLWRIYICGSSIVCFDESMLLYSEASHNHNGTKRRESFSEKQTLYLAIGFMIIPQKNNPWNKKTPGKSPRVTAWSQLLVHSDMTGCETDRRTIRESEQTDRKTHRTHQHIEQNPCWEGNTEVILQQTSWSLCLFWREAADDDISGITSGSRTRHMILSSELWNIKTVFPNLFLSHVSHKHHHKGTFPFTDLHLLARIILDIITKQNSY